MRDAENEIRSSAYAAAFVADVVAAAEFRGTTLGGALDADATRYGAAEVACRVADAAVLGLRETAQRHGAEALR